MKARIASMYWRRTASSWVVDEMRVNGAKVDMADLSVATCIVSNQLLINLPCMDPGSVLAGHGEDEKVVLYPEYWN